MQSWSRSFSREELARLVGYLGIAMDWDRVASVVQRPSLVTRQARDITKDRGEVLAGWLRAFCAAQIARARELVALCGLGDLWDACGSERRDGAQAMPAEQRAWRLP